MRNLLIATTGFLVGAGLISGLLFGLSQINTTSTAERSASAMPMGAAMNMSGPGMSSAAFATQKLTIQHVQKGCHVWSDGHMTAATMRLHMKVGQKLSITDNDVDAHQMMELAGPMHMQMGGPMMTAHGMTLAFMKEGVYRLGTKTVEMGDGGMDVKTAGPDNNLRLVVTVA
jgi:hypothetical protein